MAKATKTKKVKEVEHTAEVTHSGITESLPISEEGVIEVAPVEATIETPEPIVEEVKAEEPVIEKEEVKAPEPESKPKDAKDELSLEDKITNFIDSREAGEIKLNDFLKSTFPVPKFNEPAIWMNQASSKMVRSILDNMQRNGLINIVNDQHMRLGTFYYPDNTGVTHYHNLNTIQLVAKK